MNRPIIQDLITLTRALLHPADRIAWLALLRAPWCGLTLDDLLILAAEPAITIWENIQSAAKIALISTDGKTKIMRILPHLQYKMGERQRCSLRQLVESTWLLLGGPACSSQLTDLTDAAAFFELLETADPINDFKHLYKAVESLYAAPQPNPGQIQIMTIHNAKD